MAVQVPFRLPTVKLAEELVAAVPVVSAMMLLSERVFESKLANGRGTWVL
jgi:hypothetical protein